MEIVKEYPIRNFYPGVEYKIFDLKFDEKKIDLFRNSK